MYEFYPFQPIPKLSDLVLFYRKYKTFSTGCFQSAIIVTGEGYYPMKPQLSPTDNFLDIVLFHEEEGNLVGDIRQENNWGEGSYLVDIEMAGGEYMLLFLLPLEYIEKHKDTMFIKGITNRDIAEHEEYWVDSFYLQQWLKNNGYLTDAMLDKAAELR